MGAYALKRQEEQLIVKLWKDWCRVWPEQYGHDSLAVKPDGYDPVFDLIPSQTYRDFYFEVVRGHPLLKGLNVFEVVDAALNQIRAPEATAANRVQENQGPGLDEGSEKDRVATVDLPGEMTTAADQMIEPPEADIA